MPVLLVNVLMFRGELKSVPKQIRRKIGKFDHLGLLVLVLAFGGEQGACGAPPDSSPIVFREIAAQAGVPFRFDTGSRQRHDLPEVMGGGVALIDGDQDGWPDLYFCNGGPIGSREGKADPPGRYYRNQRDGTFRDETETARVPGPSYAMGAAVGDVDGDGRADLFVTGWRDQRLYRNEGGGSLPTSRPAPVSRRASGAPQLPSPTSIRTATSIFMSRTTWISIRTPRPTARLRTDGGITAVPKIFPPSPTASIAITATAPSPTFPRRPALPCPVAGDWAF